jgi:secreted trypsin-like serine protease
VIRNWKLAALTATLVCTHAAAAAAQETPLLVGGSNAPEQAWPSIAFLEGRYTDPGGGQRVYHCTGSVVAPSWVITAAHCAVGNPGQPPESMSVVLGVSDYTDPKGQTMDVDRFVTDPSYDPTRVRNDVALLHLSQPTSAPAMRLATAAESDAGGYQSQDGVPNAAGWGATDEAATQFTPDLQQAYVQIHSPAECGQLLGGFDATTQTCAGTSGQATACFGDSGGPLVETDASSGQAVLWGLTSYRASAVNGQAPCALAGPPVVYTWIPGFTDFIQSTLNGTVPAGPAAAAPERPAVATPPAGDVPGPGDAGARRCASARRTLATARKTERRRVRQLHAARGAHASHYLRSRARQRSHRYRLAKTRRMRAATTVRRTCAATA